MAPGAMESEKTALESTYSSSSAAASATASDDHYYRESTTSDESETGSTSSSSSTTSFSSTTTNKSFSSTSYVPTPGEPDYSLMGSAERFLAGLNDPRFSHLKDTPLVALSEARTLIWELESLRWEVALCQ